MLLPEHATQFSAAADLLFPTGNSASLYSVNKSIRVSGTTVQAAHPAYALIEREVRSDNNGLPNPYGSIFGKLNGRAKARTLTCKVISFGNLLGEEHLSNVDCKSGDFTIND